MNAPRTSRLAGALFALALLATVPLLNAAEAVPVTDKGYADFELDSLQIRSIVDCNSKTETAGLFEHGKLQAPFSDSGDGVYTGAWELKGSVITVSRKIEKEQLTIRGHERWNESPAHPENALTCRMKIPSGLLQDSTISLIDPERTTAPMEVSESGCRNPIFQIRASGYAILAPKFSLTIRFSRPLVCTAVVEKDSPSSTHAVALKTGLGMVTDPTGEVEWTMSLNK